MADEYTIWEGRVNKEWKTVMGHRMNKLQWHKLNGNLGNENG
jgi:hypothetical protein